MNAPGMVGALLECRPYRATWQVHTQFLDSCFSNEYTRFNIYVTMHFIGARMSHSIFCLDWRVDGINAYGERVNAR